MRVKTVVYLDVLLLVNFLVGYFLLRAAGLLTGAAPGFGRAVLGGAAAACSSLILLAPPLPPAFQGAYQLGTALLIVYIAFGWNGWRGLVRRTLWYTLMNLLQAGLVLLAVQRWGVPMLHTNNLAVYFDLSPLTLLLAVLSVYLCIRLGVLLFGEPPPQAWEVQIQLPRAKVRVSAGLDTGFLVRDPWTERAVLLVGWPQVRGQLDRATAEFLDAYFAGKEPVEAGLPIRLIPCRTVAGQRVLPGVVAQRVWLHQNGVHRGGVNVTVAFAPEALEANGWEALFGRDLLQQCTNRGKEGCTK